MLLTIHHGTEAESLVDSAMHGEDYAGQLQSLSPTFWTARRDFRDGAQWHRFAFSATAEDGTRRRKRKHRAPTRWVGRAGPTWGVRPAADRVAGNGLAVAAVHVVHDGGVGARRVPGEPGHRVGQFVLGPAEQAVGARDLEDHVRGGCRVSHTCVHDRPPIVRWMVQGRGDGGASSRPAQFQGGRGLMTRMYPNTSTN
jgi:hypothetical protein